MLMNEEKVVEKLNRRQRQILVHSFLYYKLNESIITDLTYDQWCMELVDLQEQYPELAKKTAYYNICQHFDRSGSGFFIKNYPPEIISTAFHLLYQHYKKRDPDLRFEDFIVRYGYSI